MRQTWMVVVLLLAVRVQAATYYISPGGADSNPGSEGAPWGTFAMLRGLSAGDTLLVMDGTYTADRNGFGGGGGGPGVVGLDCSGGPNGTPGQPITVKAQHERQAELHGAGHNVVSLYSCRGWVWEGLTITNTDNSSAGGFDSTGFYISGGQQVTVRRNLLHNPTNRAAGHNAHGIITDGGGQNLIEENEVYGVCRHGIVSRYSDGDVRRRNFVHGRGLTPSCGNYYPYPGTSECVSVYPAKNTITENNIGEDCVTAFSGHGIDMAVNNRWYGNIALRVTGGFMVGPRGGYGDGYGGANTPSQMPMGWVWEHNAVIGAGQYDTFYAFGCRACKNAQLRNFTSINALPKKNDFGAPGAIVFDPGSAAIGENGDGVDSASAENILMVRIPDGYFGVDNYATFTGRTLWMDQVGSGPLPPGIISPVLVGDAGMGTCLIVVPPESPAGKAGVGATITQRYDNGVLTAVPLWDPQTRRFGGCGAIVPGLNDMPGYSCFDVHERLHVGDACPVPLIVPPVPPPPPVAALPAPRNFRHVPRR